MKPRIAITIGDFNGIGPEVVLKSISKKNILNTVNPILIGSIDIFDFVAKKLKLKLKLVKIDNYPTEIEKNSIPVIEVSKINIKQLQVGKISPDAGVCAGMAIEKAVSLALNKSVDAIITAPISKEALHLAGYNFPGQTEMIAMLSRSEQSTMMLVSGGLRVALATIHIPIKDVASGISKERILSKIKIVDTTLKNDFKIKMPKIAVLGLNPHAGENGEIGTEEKEFISPAIKISKENNILVEGPFAADGFFGTKQFKNYDAVLAMYHDQGLIPLKLLEFENGVNFTAGIKVLRTSPDHGTAYDIANKYIANPSSMIAAIELAKNILTNRERK
ncbi:MAG: 4-hydroxythreonine-4-phosphate dehydrogenase PdxA [Bacteroidota bacterium]